MPYRLEEYASREPHPIFQQAGRNRRRRFRRRPVPRRTSLSASRMHRDTVPPRHRHGEIRCAGSDLPERRIEALLEVAEQGMAKHRALLETEPVVGTGLRRAFDGFASHFG